MEAVATSRKPWRPRPGREFNGFDWVGKVVLPAVAATAAFFAGQFNEAHKDIRADDKLALENRTKLFASTAANFSSYITQWSRLRSMTEAQIEREDRRDALVKELGLGPEKLAKLSTTKSALTNENAKLKDTLDRIMQRKEVVIKSRNDALDKLLTDFEQARLFFGPRIVKDIDAFEQFDLSQRELSIDRLAPLDEWRQHASRILGAMREEIRHEQEKYRRWWRLN